MYVEGYFVSQFGFLVFLLLPSFFKTYYICASVYVYVAILAGYGKLGLPTKVVRASLCFHCMAFEFRVKKKGYATNCLGRLKRAGRKGRCKDP